MDFYVVLGVTREASLAEVKRAYRRLARKYHPDINPGDARAETIFRRVSEAYAILSDPGRRRQYDAGVRHSTGTRAPAIEFEGFDFTAAIDGREAGTFSELFAEVFQPPTDVTPRAGEALHAELPLAFAQAMQGGSFPLTITRQAQCADCEGSGMRRRVEATCGRCGGSGAVRWARGHMVFTKDCATCGGTGRLRQLPCASCGALGVHARTETVMVPVPAGAADGHVVRLRGLGHAGLRGAEAGDLFVRVRVAPSAAFTRDGLDLHLTVPVAVHEAALGARIEVPTLNGRASVRVPAGTQTGQRFRVRGRGIPSASGQAGDLVVEVRLVLPSELDERSKSLLEEFGRLNPGDVRKDLFV